MIDILLKHVVIDFVIKDCFKRIETNFEHRESETLYFKRIYFKNLNLAPPPKVYLDDSDFSGIIYMPYIPSIFTQT